MPLFTTLPIPLQVEHCTMIVPVPVHSAQGSTISTLPAPLHLGHVREQSADKTRSNRPKAVIIQRLPFMKIDPPLRPHDQALVNTGTSCLFYPKKILGAKIPGEPGS